jgi:hypothetical protein
LRNSSKRCANSYNDVNTTTEDTPTVGGDPDAGDIDPNTISGNHHNPVTNKRNNRYQAQTERMCTHQIQMFWN